MISDPEQRKEEARKQAVLYRGSDGMRSALSAVMKKAAQGERVVLAALGDSITFGAGAEPGGEWASLVAARFEALDGNSENGNVTLVNAGIGGTEAVYGAARLRQDVLPFHPDLVIVDFGTNDFGLPHGAEAYEGILTQLIAAGIPVINCNVCPRSGNNLQEQQLPINRAYGVPQISFRSAVQVLLNDSETVGLREEDLWTADNVHPTPKGHRLLAELILRFLDEEIPNCPTDAPFPSLPAAVTANRFADAVLIDRKTPDPRVKTELGEGWTADYEARLEQIESSGWQTSRLGSTITFTTDSSCFFLFYTNSKKSGGIEVRVDGKPTHTVTNAYNAIGYKSMSIAFVVMAFDAPGRHTVTLTLTDIPETEKDWCGLCAVGASGFGSE